MIKKPFAPEVQLGVFWNYLFPFFLACIFMFFLLSIGLYVYAETIPNKPSQEERENYNMSIRKEVTITTKVGLSCGNLDKEIDLFNGNVCAALHAHGYTGYTYREKCPEQDVPDCPITY